MSTESGDWQSRLPSRQTFRQNPLKIAVGVATITFAFIGFLQPVHFIFINNTKYTIVLVMLSATIYWLNLYQDPEDVDYPRFVKALAAVFAVLSLVAGAYMFLNFQALLTERIGLYTDQDYIFGAIVLASILLATYFEYGTVLFLFAVASLGYGYFGGTFPGILQHGGIGIRVISANTVELDGVFGFVSEAGARWVFIFLIFAGVLKAFGGLEMFTQLGLRIARHLSSGIQQTAVISSLMVGSLVGSAPANSALTGSFTIPLMKEHGVEKDVAGAIESVASTGAQIMPPIMGIAAFIMADLLPISYAEVITRAAIPAIIFYFCVALSVHLYTVKLMSQGRISVKGLEETSADIDILPRKEAYLLIAPFVVAIGALIYLLVGPRWAPGRAAYWTIIILVGAVFGREILANSVLEKEKSLVDRFIETALDFFAGLYDGMISMAPLAIVLAALNVVIKMFGITGFGNRMSLQLLTLTEVHVAVFLLAVVAIVLVLGMGVPTIAAYILTVFVAVPSLVEFGYAEVAAHFFVFYIAIMSNITPPVAVACAVTASIADAGFLSTCKQALKIGFIGFIIPFIILLNPGMINLVFPDFIIIAIVSTIGLSLLVVAIQNWSPSDKPLRTLNRAGFVFTGLAILTALMFVI